MTWLSHQFIRIMKLVTSFFGRAAVEDMDVDDVARLLEAGGDSFVLVDARSEAETSVSMIPGAVTRQEFESRRDELAGKTVVAYCTVGGRSLLYAQRCAKDGMEARNFRGGILAWCAAQRPLVTPNGCPTKRLHTHNRWFDVPAGYEQVH